MESSTQQMIVQTCVQFYEIMWHVQFSSPYLDITQFPQIGPLRIQPAYPLDLQRTFPETSRQEMGQSESKPKRVAVLGGGPAGLTAAYRLLQSETPIHVDVYEASNTFGGAMLSEKSGGFQYDLGANSMNAKHADVHHFLHKDLQLTDRMQSRESARRFLIVKDGKLMVVPMTPAQFVTSGILSTRAKLRMLVEPLIPRVSSQRAADRESVGDFFQRRFGKEVVDYLVDPMLAGIYSSAPAQLSMKHALSSVWRVERAKGSVIGGMLRGGMKTEPDPRYPDLSRNELMRSFSFDEGMGVLPETLVARLKDAKHSARLYRNSSVRSLERDDRGRWKVNGKGKYDAVISTIPTYGLKSIASNVRAVQRGFKKLAAQIAYVPVSVVVLGFDKAQMPTDVHGFGTLVPSREERNILGVNFSSEGFPARLSDPSKVFWTVYMGGSRKPKLVSQSETDIVDSSMRDLRDVFGVSGSPCFARVQSWPDGIPVYAPGYDKALCTMGRIEKGAPGLVLGGNYRGGVGVPDALLSGIRSAERVEKFLNSPPRKRWRSVPWFYFCVPSFVCVIDPWSWSICPNDYLKLRSYPYVVSHGVIYLHCRWTILFDPLALISEEPQ